MRGLVTCDVVEDGPQDRIAFGFGAVLLRLVSGIGRGFLDRSIARHLAPGRKGRNPFARIDHLFEGLDFAGAAQSSRAGSEIASTNRCIPIRPDSPSNLL